MTLDVTAPAPDVTGVAARIARILAGNDDPLTVVLRKLSGAELRTEVLSSGMRDLSAAEHLRFSAGLVTRCFHRTGLLRVRGSGLVAAETVLSLIVSRVPPEAMEALETTDIPAGLLLEPYGMTRSRRKAEACAGVLDTAGGQVAVISSAVLMLGRKPAGYAQERITADFALLAARHAE